MLTAALDTDGDSGNDVDQDNEAALEITRDSNGNATAVTKLDMSNTGWGYSGGSTASWSIDTNNNGLQAGGHTWYVIGVDNYKDGPASTTNPATKNGGNVKLTGDSFLNQFGSGQILDREFDPRFGCLADDGLGPGIALTPSASQGDRFA